jgi:hypothetical protein
LSTVLGLNFSMSQNSASLRFDTFSLLFFLLLSFLIVCVEWSLCFCFFRDVMCFYVLQRAGLRNRSTGNSHQSEVLAVQLCDANFSDIRV